MPRDGVAEGLCRVGGSRVRECRDLRGQGDAVVTGETVTYLRHKVVLHDDRQLSIYTPDGRLIFTGRMRVSTARNVIRGYRREAA